MAGGGDGGIRTLETGYPVWFLSRELVSATHPRLRKKGAYSERYGGHQGCFYRQCAVEQKLADKSGPGFDWPRNPLDSRHIHCRNGCMVTGGHGNCHRDPVRRASAARHDARKEHGV